MLPHSLRYIPAKSDKVVSPLASDTVTADGAVLLKANLGKLVVRKKIQGVSPALFLLLLWAFLKANFDSPEHQKLNGECLPSR